MIVGTLQKVNFGEINHGVLIAVRMRDFTTIDNSCFNHKLLEIRAKAQCVLSHLNPGLKTRGYYYRNPAFRNKLNCKFWKRDLYYQTKLVT